MGSVEPAADEASRIRHAADAVLNDTRFVRSPVLSRLLGYLVEKSIAGEKVNSFTIAMDGLGRSSIDLSEADTYARVAVARLRRALHDLYAASAAAERLVIETGTYSVRIEAACTPLDALHDPDPEPHPASAIPPVSPRRWPAPVRMAAGIGLAILLLAVGLLVWHGERGQDKWSTPDLPKVSVIFAQSPLPPAMVERYRQEYLGALSAYVGVIVVDGASGPVDFALKVFPEREELLFVLEETRTGRIVWSVTKSARTAEPSSAIAESVAATIASPNGILHSYARRQGYEADSPYGCWLRFTENVQSYNTIGDEVLEDCASTWYSVAPQRPLAAFLYGWTLTDRSVTQLRADTRRKTLKEAITVLNRAQAANPDSAVLHVAEMRAHSFLGDRRRVIAEARQAIRTARNNRQVIGMAASGMATWNDPQGAEILRGLQSGSDIVFPWENVGLFIAAMMADDVAAAGRQIGEIEAFEAGQPLLVFLTAAYAGRTGDSRRAAAALERLGRYPLTSFATPGRVIDRLPVAPEVKARLRAWIGPAAAQ